MCYSGICEHEKYDGECSYSFAELRRLRAGGEEPCPEEDDGSTEDEDEDEGKPLETLCVKCHNSDKEICELCKDATIL